MNSIMGLNNVGQETSNKNCHRNRDCSRCDEAMKDYGAVLEIMKKRKWLYEQNFESLADLYVG